MGAAPPQRLVYAPFSTLERANGSAGAIPGLQPRRTGSNTTEHVREALRTVIGLSPPTRPDCFRHYELLTAGDIVVTTEHERPTASRSSRTARVCRSGCSGDRYSASSASAPFPDLGEIPHEKLTVEYWRDYVKTGRCVHEVNRPSWPRSAIDEQQACVDLCLLVSSYR